MYIDKGYLCTYVRTQQIDMTTGSHALIRCVFLLSMVAFVSDMLITFYARWTIHTNTLLQYSRLAMSDTCSKPHLRVQSEQVNNCAKAERITTGGTLPPATLALLETLQRLSLCAGELEATGVVRNRCDAIVDALVGSSTTILLLLVVCILCTTWIARQYNAVRVIRNTQLPLDYNDYPSGLPPWLRESQDTS